MAVIQILAAILHFLWHPYHVSMTDINYNGKSKCVEISVRMFTEDFENVLRKSCKCKVDLYDSQNAEAMQKLVSAYIQQHLQIDINSKRQTLFFMGYKQQEESTWGYFEIKNTEPIKKLEMMNTLLCNYFSDQTNMLHIHADGREVNDKLDCPQSRYVFTY